jgi:hypothetical protein
MPAPVTFKFNQQAQADAYYKQIVEAQSDDPLTPLEIADDFGHTHTFRCGDVRHHATIDVEKDIEGQIETSVLQSRGQMRAQQRVQNDAALHTIIPAQGLRLNG